MNAKVFEISRAGHQLGMAKRGRPKIDEQRQKVILEAVKAGMPLTHAARKAGVHPATLHAWKAKGREQETGVYRDFYDNLKKVESEFIFNALKGIRDIGTKAKQWTALAWLLERRYPEIFGLQSQRIVELERIVKSLEENRGTATPPPPGGPAPG